MKKTVIFFIGILLAAGAAAQSHSFRDTSYTKYRQFDFPGFLEDTTDGTAHCTSRFGAPGGPRPADIVQYNYTDNPDGMRVAGISAAIHTDYSPYVCPMDPPEYLLLYDAMTDTFQLMDSVQWEVCDTAGRPTFDWIAEAHGGKESFLTVFQIPAPRYYCIFDMYFDEPVTVYDSFYVGGTLRMPTGYGDNWEAWYFTYTLARLDTVTNTLYTNYKPILRKMYSYASTGITNQWYWEQTNQWMIVFPIIEMVDTSFANAPECPRVSGLFSRGNYTDTVTVQWAQDSLHSEFEVSYGREGTAPDDGTIVTVRNANRWQFTDVAYRDIPMVSYVRTVCREYDTLRWSGWSSPVRWRLHHEEGDTTHHEGIEVAEGGDLSRFVRLMPNPASGSVMVMSSYGMEQVRVYDARGGKVYDSPADGTTAGFDVSSWAKGAYVVHVRTHAGTAAKRLVVQ